MKKLLFFFFIIKTSLIFSQGFNDKIITVKGDTIIGKIVSVSDFHIIYYTKVDTQLNFNSLSMKTVKHIIIDRDNHPQLTVTGKSQAIISKSDKNLSMGKVLIIEQTKFFRNHDKPKKVIFAEGDRIVIKSNNIKKIDYGRIEGISDSAVFVDGDRININDIKRISKHRDGALLVIGLSSFVFFSGLAIVSDPSTWQKNNNNNTYLNEPGTFEILTAAFAFFDLLTIVPAGIIRLATTKNYRMDNGWKIYIAE